MTPAAGTKIETAQAILTVDLLSNLATIERHSSPVDQGRTDGTLEITVVSLKLGSFGGIRPHQAPISQKILEK